MSLIVLSGTTQTDLAYAAINSLVTSSSAQNISAGTWSISPALTAGVNANGVALSITPWTQTCNPAVRVSTSVNSAWALGKTFTPQSMTGLVVGMVVWGTGINLSGANRIASKTATTITLTTNGNTSSIGTVLFFDPASKLTSGTWTPTGTSSSSKITVPVDSTNGVTANMLVSGAGVINSGTNTVKTVAANSITLNTGPNISSNNALLIFTNPAPACTNAYNDFFYLNNTGTIDASSMSITLSSSPLGAITLETCNTAGISSTPVAWNVGAHSCPNQKNTFVTDGISHILPIAAGTNLQVHLLSTTSGATASVSVTIQTSDLRTSLSTNS